MIEIVDVAIIDRNKILLVEKNYSDGHSSIILPGGKIEQDESDLDCLIREVGEELGGIEIKINPHLYGKFNGVTLSSRKDAIVRVYFGCLLERRTVQPSKEIGKVIWSEYGLAMAQPNLSPITQEILESLRRDHYLR